VTERFDHLVAVVNCPRTRKKAVDKQIFREDVPTESMNHLAEAFTASIYFVVVLLGWVVEVVESFCHQPR
jgi:hypothetical protein